MDFRKILFKPQTCQFMPGASTDLEELFIILKGNPRMTIRIEAYSCCDAGKEKDAYCEESQKFDLSLRRANTVAAYILKKGITPDRIGVLGHGFSQPENPGRVTKAEIKQHGRIEIRVMAL